MPADGSSRRGWAVSGLALIAAAFTGAAATYLWWLPCQGRMLVGTAYGPRYSDSLLGRACIDRMNDGTPFPLPTGVALSTPGLLHLSTLTVLLVGVAWLVPVACLPRDVSARVGISLPGWAVVVVAALGVVTGFGGLGIGYLADLLLNVFVLVSVVLLIGQRAPGLARFVVAALPVSALGFVGMVVDYSLMIRWSDADWDSPPGSGYLSAALFLVCGVTVLVMTAVGGRRQPTDPRVVLQEVLP